MRVSLAVPPGKMLGACAVVIALSPVVLMAQTSKTVEKTTSTRTAKPADIYDTKADARTLIASAVAKAGRENKRVLVMFGGNWCGWCHKLHDVFKTDREVSRLLLNEYEVVLVDTALDGVPKLLADFKADIQKNGVPYLTVLDGDGKVVTNQETSSLEEGDHHDPRKVKAFLAKWVAEPKDARKVLEDGLSRAGVQQKVVFLHLGAPWCGWCHRLDDFLAREKVAEILARDFVDLKIDVDRMTNGKDVAKQFRPDQAGGIPWFAFLDSRGKVLVTSDGPKGNIGFPAERSEIDHFMSMLKKVATRISPEQMKEIEKALQPSPAQPNVH